ncbi:MAG: replication-associated recombination protein A, partial [Candidatus Dadabacteria bacterium]
MKAKKLPLSFKTHTTKKDIPLAEKLRPTSWEEVAGINVEKDPFWESIAKGKGKLFSLLLWGPAGCGKTTIAYLIGKSYAGEFIKLSAVLSSVAEIKKIALKAEGSLVPPLLFIDELHRFNKAQQDALLPFIEKGQLILIGATTENPSFALTSALLSRLKVISLNPLSKDDLLKVLTRAFKVLNIEAEKGAAELLLQAAGGDARQLLNTLELCINKDKVIKKEKICLLKEDVEQVLSSLSQTFIYDRSGENHYNLISAFIKSLRGSDPDAALYWGFRIIESGEDPRYLIRRMIIFAAEDIGNADPQALQLAIATSQAYEQVGLPEGKIPIAQCIVYLATAEKSNSSYQAMLKAIECVKKNKEVSVPLHLRNAATPLLKSKGYGAGYKYPHNFEESYVK